MRRTYFIFLLPYYCPVVSVPKPRSSNSTLPWAVRFLILTSSPSPPALVFVLLCGGSSSKAKIFQQYTAMGGPFSYLDFCPFPTRVIVCLVVHVCVCVCVGGPFFILGGGGGCPVPKPRSSNSTLPWADRFLILTSSPFPPASLFALLCMCVCVFFFWGGGGSSFKAKIFQQYTAMGGPFSYLDFVPFPTRVIVCLVVHVCVFFLGGGGVQFQSQDLPTVHCHGRTVFLS